MNKESIKFAVMNFLWIIVFLWNLDGFWQLNFDSITQFQQNYFLSKYENEQKKLNFFEKNSLALIEKDKEVHSCKSGLSKTKGDLEFSRNELREYKQTGLKEIKNNIIKRIQEIDIFALEELNQKKLIESDSIDIITR